MTTDADTAVLGVGLMVVTDEQNTFFHFTCRFFQAKSLMLQIHFVLDKSIYVQYMVGHWIKPRGSVAIFNEQQEFWYILISIIVLAKIINIYTFHLFLLICVRLLIPHRTVARANRRLAQIRKETLIYPPVHVVLNLTNYNVSPCFIRSWG